MILLVDTNPKGSLWYREFCSPIAALIKGPYEVKHYTEVQDVEQYEKVIISGSGLGYTEYLDYLECFMWLNRTSKRVLGICAGMQVIGMATGGKPVIDHGIGLVTVTTRKENPLFRGTFNAYALHSYAVKPGPDVDILATSTRTIEAIRYKNLIGVLFHPEVRNPEIILRFLIT